MSEFKTIETQEELDRIIGERLARQKEKFGDYDQLKERVTQLENENGVLKSAAEVSKQTAADYDKKIADLEGKVAGYETSALRTRIALQNGLPFDLAERLQGNDEASLTADAERLASFLKPAEHSAPLKFTEPDTQQSSESAWMQVVKDLTKGE